MRVAAIDIGTNSVLLTVVERDPGGKCRTLLDRATITRLGQDVDRTGQLAPEAVARTLACLAAYAATIRELGVDRLTAVGTSALRDAGNADVFTARAVELLGAEPRVIGGTVEAELTFRGALSGLSVMGSVLVIDIGGGSTEVILGHAAANSVRADTFRSYDIGCVRLTERHVSTDPPTATALDAIAASTQATLAGLAVPECQVVAVAGTATTLAAVQLGLATYDSEKVHGCTLSLGQLKTLSSRLSRATHAERCCTPGLDPKRADVIVAGSVMLAAALEMFGQDRLTVSDRGVRFGLIDELLMSKCSV